MPMHERQWLWLFLPNDTMDVYASIEFYRPDTHRKYVKAIDTWRRIRSGQRPLTFSNRPYKAAQYDHLLVSSGHSIENARQPWKLARVEERETAPPLP